LKFSILTEKWLLFQEVAGCLRKYFNDVINECSLKCFLHFLSLFLYKIFFYDFLFSSRISPIFAIKRFIRLNMRTNKIFKFSFLDCNPNETYIMLCTAHRHPLVTQRQIFCDQFGVRCTVTSVLYDLMPFISMFFGRFPQFTTRTE